jgi:hypothetical protein
VAPDTTSQPKPAADPSKEKADDDTSASWQHVVALVAAAAGGAAWVSAIGSAVVGLRLENAELPVESVVALMSAEHRFAIGGGYLLVPMFVGLVGFAVDWWVTKREPTEMRRREVAVVTIVAASVLGGLLIQPAVPFVFVLQSAALLLAVVAAIHLYRDRPPDHHRIDERLIVFVAVLVSAGAIALVHEQFFADATFDTADIRLTEGVTVEGGYVTTTDTAVLLITSRIGGCPTITAVRRDRIEQVRIGPGKLQVEMPDRQPCTRTVDFP